MREKSTQKSTAKIQIGIWEFRGENPHCKDLALTFLKQPSTLEIFGKKHIFKELSVKFVSSEQ